MVAGKNGESQGRRRVGRVGEVFGAVLAAGAPQRGADARGRGSRGASATGAAISVDWKGQAGVVECTLGKKHNVISRRL